MITDENVLDDGHAAQDHYEHGMPVLAFLGNGKDAFSCLGTETAEWMKTGRLRYKHHARINENVTRLLSHVVTKQINRRNVEDNLNGDDYRLLNDVFEYSDGLAYL